MLRRSTPEHIPHQQISRNIEYRTDRPDADHETAQIGSIPLTRLQQIFTVDLVKRYRRLRNIIQQVLYQQMNRKHRQERQESTRRQYTEHITEI